MGAFDRWRPGDNRPNRVFDRGQVEQNAEADRARQRALDVARLRRVWPGLVVDLEPADWLSKTAPGFDRRVQLVVAKVHEPVEYRQGVGWAHVWGHTVRCGARPDHAPCVDVLARLDALVDALDRQ
ncbi:hypothetical protein O7626_31310 [Micromonospora sp. WMMD1102]|uniref:hypothetical protein n=1 Tax=Micromonospora sp. WMMD1102 TaxID=3016105 RepID=UPI002414E314|nr:hypothetical protein [Micromonospora sp. WMMD1102]MDG4790357.1 hypothetical protein [Micromonospora sp. WMMD1102]